MAVGGWENVAGPEKKWSLDSLRWANGRHSAAKERTARQTSQAAAEMKVEGLVGSEKT